MKATLTEIALRYFIVSELSRLAEIPSGFALDVIGDGA